MSSEKEKHRDLQQGNWALSCEPLWLGTSSSPLKLIDRLQKKWVHELSWKGSSSCRFFGRAISNPPCRRTLSQLLSGLKLFAMCGNCRQENRVDLNEQRSGKFSKAFAHPLIVKNKKRRAEFSLIYLVPSK